MVAVAQLVEPWIVIPVVVGSSPISHPIFLTSGCQAGAERAAIARLTIWAVSSIGRAVDS